MPSCCARCRSPTRHASTASATATTAASRAVRRIAGACSRIPLFERLKAERPEFEELTAFQAGGCASERPAPGRGHRREAAAVGIRHRQLLHDPRHWRVRRTRVHRRRRQPAAPPVVVHQPSRLAGDLRRRSSLVGSTLVIEGHPFTVVGVDAAGLLRRDAARQSARPLDPASAGTADHRRQLAAAPAGLRVAARHRPPEARRHDRRHRAAAHGRSAPVDPARLGLSGELDAGRHPACCRSR